MRLTRFGGDCYIFAAMALGFVDLIVEAGFQPWDVAALMPIVEGAGGVITSWNGGSLRPEKPFWPPGDKRVHSEAMELLDN